MLIIPTQAIPAQTFGVTLAGQNCVISLYQKTPGMFIDVTLSGTPILTGIICRSRVRLVRQAYLGFTGDLAFLDTQGQSDPVYTGLGARWLLAYLETADLALIA